MRRVFSILAIIAALCAAPHARSQGMMVTPTQGLSTSVRTTLIRTTDQTINPSSLTPVSWSSAAIDIPGAWSAGAPTHVTVPTGYTHAIVSGAMYYQCCFNIAGPIYGAITDTTAAAQAAPVNRGFRNNGVEPAFFDAFDVPVLMVPQGRPTAN